MTRSDVAIVGAGQAGLSLSHCLTRDGIEHVIFERDEIASNWRNGRWDSFCLVTPNWATRLAGQPYAGDNPHGFMPRDELIACLENYASSFAAPVDSPTEVLEVATGLNEGFELRFAGREAHRCRVAVIATATHAWPQLPAWARELDLDVRQLHASEYRNPAQLPAGAVLVVGSAQSGTQIADELNRAGREVWLATGRTGRLPRRYRGRDIIEWQRRMGFLDRRAEALDDPAHRFRPDPHLTGAGGGRTLDLRDLSLRGVRLAGRVERGEGDRLWLADDLPTNLAFADEFAGNVLAAVDRHILQAGVTAPAADELNSDLGYAGEPFVPASPLEISLQAEGIRTVIWATGFRHDFSWVRPAALDEFGYPVQRDGRTPVDGLHFLGLNYVDRRGSGILYGVGEDAEQIAGLVAARLDPAARR